MASPSEQAECAHHWCGCKPWEGCCVCLDCGITGETAAALKSRLDACSSWFDAADAARRSSLLPFLPSR